MGGGMPWAGGSQMGGGMGEMTGVGFQAGGERFGGMGARAGGRGGMKDQRGMLASGYQMRNEMRGAKVMGQYGNMQGMERPPNRGK